MPYSYLFFFYLPLSQPVVSRKTLEHWNTGTLEQSAACPEKRSDEGSAVGSRHLASSRPLDICNICLMASDSFVFLQQTS